MDEFERNDLEKNTNDSHNTFCQNVIHYKERKCFRKKNNKCGIFSLVYVIKLGGRMTEIFSMGLQA